MKRARKIVEDHFACYGAIPQPHRLVDAIAAALGFVQLGAIPHRDSVDEMLAALKGLVNLGKLPGENSLDYFERVAERFHQETGILAPGKDDAIGAVPREQMEAAWNAWRAEKYEKARDVIAKAEGRL